MRGRHHALVVLGLLALTALLYAQTLDDEWHFDDRSEITSRIRSFAPALDVWHYRGIVVRWVWAADYRLHGDDPTGYHVTNGIVHAANAILVYWIAWMLVGTGRAATSASPSATRRGFGALVAASVFCAHPLATQSVTYITQRSTSLATLFFLISLGSWIRFRAGGAVGGVAGARRLAYGLASLIFFAVGLHTKHVVVMVPGMLLIFEFLFRPVRRRLALLLLVGFVGLGVWRAVEYIPSVQRSARSAVSIARPAPASETGAPVTASAVPNGSIARRASSVANHSHTSAEYLFTQPRSVATYLRLFVWPAGQNLDWDVRPSRTPADPAVLGSLAILFALGYAAWRQRHRRSTIPFGVALFFLALAPTSSFVRSADLLFEHRAYLPMVGLCFAFGDVADLLRCARPRLALVGIVLLVGMLSVVTWRRNAAWDSDLSLWSDVVAKSPKGVRGHINLGMAWQREGRLDAAEREYRLALKIAPRQPAAMNDLGNVLRRWGRGAEAESLYRAVIEVNPRAVEAWINLGNLAIDGGDFAEAERLYREALEFAPRDRGARYNLAKSLEGQRRVSEAIVEYEGLIRDHPKEAQFHNDLGAARVVRGDPAAAERDLRRAIDLRGNWEVPWYNLGLALEALGRTDEARAAYRRSLEIVPRFAPARERIEEIGDETSS